MKLKPYEIDYIVACALAILLSILVMYLIN